MKSRKMLKRILALLAVLSLSLSTVFVTVSAEETSSDTVCAETAYDTENSQPADETINLNDDSDQDETDSALSVISEINEENASEETTTALDEGNTDSDLTEEIGKDTDSDVEEKSDSAKEEDEVSEYAASIGDEKYETLTEAVNAAVSGDTVILNADVQENIEIKSSITLDLNAHTLTGTGTDAVVSICGDIDVTVKNGTVTGGNNAGNGGGFAVDGAAVLLESLTISGNNAKGSGSGDAGGAGVFAANANLTLSNSTVANNESNGSTMSDGGAVLTKNSTLTIKNSAIENNTASDCGGGICASNTELYIESSTIQNNQSKQGAGLYLTGTSSVNMNYAAIQANSASSIGGGMYLGSGQTLEINNSEITSNTAVGGSSNQGGGIVMYGNVALTLNNTSVTQNESASGGGIFAMAVLGNPSVVLLTGGSRVDENKASGFGGGIYAYALGGPVFVTVENGSVNGNEAYGGAGIFSYGASASVMATVNVQANGAVCGNKSTSYGGGVYAYQFTKLTAYEGCMLYNNTAAVAADDLFINGSSSFNIPSASTMSGDRFLSSDSKKITGWYYDGWYKWNSEAKDGEGGYEAISRWESPLSDDSPYYDEYVPAGGDLTCSASLKAAHGVVTLHTVKYDLKGGESSDDSNAADYYLGDSVRVISEPTRDGYSFTGWTIEGLPERVKSGARSTAECSTINDIMEMNEVSLSDSNDIVALDNDSLTETINSGDIFEMPANDVTLIANWAANDDGGKVNPDDNPDVNPDVDPDVNPDDKPDVNPDIKPDDNTDVDPDVKPDVKPNKPDSSNDNTDISGKDTKTNPAVTKVASAETSVTSDSPKTGDTSSAALWIVLIVISAAGLAYVTCKIARRSNS